MKQWDIYEYPYPSAEQPHFFILISPDGICENPVLKLVNGLLCQTVRPINRPAKLTEVYLDRVDGFDWKTLVHCEFIHSLEKEKVFGARKGKVSPARVEEIRRKLRLLF
jgi:mRNA-degrading endonuclease toxin of MazEF toxin-antitoxin module